MTFRKGDEDKSQSNEDEIIVSIFRKIGEGNKRFVEIGSGDGRQNNTLRLMYYRDWTGVWYDWHKKRCNSAARRWEGFVKGIEPKLKIVRRAVSPGNVNKIVSDEVDFLSIDIDGADYAVWKAITSRPRVVCIEYAEQPAGKIKQHPSVSLDDMVALGKDKGYVLVAISESNVNAFFVRSEEWERFVRSEEWKWPK